MSDPGLLDAAERLPEVAVLPGEAGIGKTTLWLAGIDAASERGYRVLSLATLRGRDAALLRGAGRPARRRGRRDLAGAAADPAAGARGRAAARRGGDRATTAPSARPSSRRSDCSQPTVPSWLAVDDIQWLDAASLGRPLHARPTRPRACRCAPGCPRRRAGMASPCRVRGAPADGCGHRVERRRDPELLRTRRDATFPRPTLIRIWEASRGNPFFALELAGALQRRGGTLAPGEDPPIPTDLDELLRARLDGLSRQASSNSHGSLRSRTRRRPSSSRRSVVASTRL